VGDAKAGAGGARGADDATGAPDYADVLQAHRAAVLEAAARAGLVRAGAEPTLVPTGASAALAFEDGATAAVVRVVPGSDATWGADRGAARTYGVVYAFDAAAGAAGTALRVELFRPFGLVGARVLSVRSAGACACGKPRH
jgi:hypothetical protein